MLSFDNSRVHGYRVEGMQYSMRQVLVNAGRFFATAPLDFALEARTRKEIHPEDVGRHSFHQIQQVNPLRVIQGCARLYALLNGFGPDLIVADVALRFSSRIDQTTHMGVSIQARGTQNESYELYRISVFIASVFQHINAVGGVWFRYHEPTDETIFIGVNYAGFDLVYNQAWAVRNSRLIMSLISRYLMQIVACTELSKDDVMDLFSEFALQNLALRSYHGRGNVERWLPQGIVGASRSSEDFLFSSCILSLGFSVQGETVPLPLLFADLVRRHVNRKMDVLFDKGYYNVNFVQRQTIRVGLTSTVLDRIVERGIGYTLIIPMMGLIRARYPDSLDKNFFKDFKVNVQLDRVSVYLSPTQDLGDWQRAAQITNVLLALYPEATIDHALAGVPAVGEFLDPDLVHPQVTFNMVLDRAWYSTQGMVAIHLPANVQGVMYLIYADREYKFGLNEMMRSVQNWLLSEIHAKA